jgi:GNAT superfamily N-acetyltransferase
VDIRNLAAHPATDAGKLPARRRQKALRQARLSALIGLNVPADWLSEAELAALRLGDLRLDPDSLPWSVRAVALHHSGEMIGHAGFHSRPAPGYLAAWAPDAVEVGYAIYAPHRRQGYAHEALVALVRWAHVEQGVPRFVASVSPGQSGVLRSAGPGRVPLHCLFHRRGRRSAACDAARSRPLIRLSGQ